MTTRAANRPKRCVIEGALAAEILFERVDGQPFVAVYAGTLEGEQIDRLAKWLHGASRWWQVRRDRAAAEVKRQR